MGINDFKMDEFYLIVGSDVRRCKLEKGTDIFQFLGFIIDHINDGTVVSLVPLRCVKD